MNCPKCDVPLTKSKFNWPECPACHRLWGTNQCVACGAPYLYCAEPPTGVWHDHHCDPRKLGHRRHGETYRERYHDGDYGPKEAYPGTRLGQGFRMLGDDYGTD